jgi:hypothetical protein
MKLLALLLLTVTAAAATDVGLPYPFGPWTDPEDAKVAAKFRERLEQAGGIERAIRRVCAHSMSSGVEDAVASNFLVERATETYPALLDAMIKEDKARDSEARATCAGNLEGTARFGVCYGHVGDGSGDEADAHPLAVARRAGVHRALAKAIAGGGARAPVAMDLLLEAGSSANGSCAGLADAVRTATPVLVRWLGVPKSPSRIPGDVLSTEEKWDAALRALSFGGADRAIAEKPVGAFLVDDATAPLATLALARMGVNVAAEAPRLARILDGIVLSDHRRGAKYSQQQLTLLEDSVDALGAVGKAARATLPNIAAFVARVEMPGCHSLGAARYIHLVQAVATEADTDQAVAALAPLLDCQGPTDPVVKALVDLGPAARAPIVGVLRDDARTIRERLAALDALLRTDPSTLEARDQRLVTLLKAKAKGAPTELDRCRAEAALPEAPTTTVPPPPELMTCLSRYLCGPGKEVYQQTIERCCRSAARAGTPGVCAGVRDTSSATAPRNTRSPR